MPCLINIFVKQIIRMDVMCTEHIIHIKKSILIFFTGKTYSSEG